MPDQMPVPPQYQPHALPEGMAWNVGSGPGTVLVQVFDATGIRFLFMDPAAAELLASQLTEQAMVARTGLVVSSDPIPPLNGHEL